MEGQEGNRGRPTSLSLSINHSPSKRASSKSPRRSPSKFDHKSHSPRIFVPRGPPPGFGAIPAIKVTPPSPSPASYGSCTTTPDSESLPQSPATANIEYHFKVLRRRIHALMEGYSNAKMLELTILALIEATFPGQKLQVFLDTLTRQVLCDPFFQAGRRVAAMIIRSLILRGSIPESAVMSIISNGVIKDLGNLLVLPQGTGDLAGFLADLFLMEPDLKWLLELTNNVPPRSAISTELIHGVIQSWKLRVPLAEVHSRITKTLENGWKGAE